MQVEKFEQCGIVGVVSKTGRNVAPLIYRGLLALQHRGQDAAGMSVFDGNKIITKKSAGLVSSVFTDQDLLMEGHVGIGHNRYRTSGLSRPQDIQPFCCDLIGIAHNGQLTNYDDLKSEFFPSTSLTSDVDSELFLHALKQQLSDGIEKSVRFILEKFDGAYSVVALIKDKLVVFRDRFGLRPLVYGENSEFIGFASESCALESMDLIFTGDVSEGELIVADKENFQRKWLRIPDPHHCMFEYVYFSRSDSKINMVDVFEARRRMGRLLADESPIDADVVVGIPDTARIAAHAFAERLGISCEEGLIKNRFLLRTFILSEQKKREEAVRLKVSPVSSVLRGRRVVLIDDSIVRGTTTSAIINIVREAGAREIHVRVTCPPITNPCYSGIDMSTKEELIASTKSVGEIQIHLGADSLAYLSLSGLKRAIGVPLCVGCLNGEYPYPL
ncbi:MAG: amidophosphoribosyltransferase [Candidatus Micrarchaeota archaeon]|nr:amidophosphoribosyltransferase [Candidatus Micrarchaeota archaeon]MBU1886346.1 amidophosphoribosyltransferase [Candidatus Micrarchaeota archaeon]